MNSFENKEVKKYLLLCIIISLSAAVIMIAVTVMECRYYKTKVNHTIADILGNIKEQVPEFEEEQIIEILNSNKNSHKGYQILKQYGIEEDTYAVLEMKHLQERMVIYNTIILLITVILIILLFCFYLKYRQKKLNEISTYIEQISKGNYSLDLKDTSEDELNSLKNQLYKITVMLKEQAIHSKAQKEALATSVSDISHQLKTPLTSISVLLDNLSESETMDSHTRRRFLNEISRQVTNIHWMVVSLLKLSRLDAGVVEFENSKIPMDQLIKEIVSNLEVIAELKNVEIAISCQENIILHGDYNWNKEAIQNILKNAIEHTDEGSSVLLKVEENSVYIRVTIIDHGQGISKKDLKHIFERFYQSENAREDSVGIGLHLAKTIIEKQNGYVTADSEKGKGTTFTIKYMKI